MATAPKSDSALKQDKPVQRIRAIYGNMVDMESGIHYSQQPSELLKRTGWINSQLEAKKMELL